VGRAEHRTAAARREGLPAPGGPEIAFLGRSNVGKSSLLNRLVGRRALAHTSATPGKTRLIHFYDVALLRPPRELVLVDLPGYGFAKVPRREREAWQRLVEGYLEDRPSLRAAVLLQDLRRDVSEDETLLLAWLAERGVAALVAVTKTDRERPARRAGRMKALREGFALPAERLIATSARTGEGIDRLWAVLLERAFDASPGRPAPAP